MNWSSSILGVSAAAFAISVAAAQNAGPPPAPKNLQVLPKDITRPHREGLLSNFHIFPVWDDTAIDFTARQFWLEADYPLVAPLDTYKTRFERVEVWPLAEMGHPRWTQDSRLLLVRHDVR